MFYYEGYTCPVCGKEFSEEEDIVSCPDCGLPHHRSCWVKNGHCHLEHLHGTDKQWSRDHHTMTEEDTKAENAPTFNRCSRCQTDNPQFAEICARCGAPLKAEKWENTATNSASYSEYTPFQSPFDGNNGYVLEEKIGQHYTKDLAAVVGNNTLYYLPRFQRMENGESGGWNWGAFFFGPYWLLYRKNYVLGILLFVVQTIFSFATTYILPMSNSTEEMMSAVEALLADDSRSWLLLPLFVLSAILTVVKILLGLQGNRLYLSDCKKRIDQANLQEGGVSTAELSGIGGVSMTAAVIAYLIPGILSYILAIIQMM